MPGQPVVLETLGGLVSSARPESIPEGASPRTYDTDFTIGRVIQRAGEESVYSFNGVTFGPNLGGLAVSVGDNQWLNPNNILANDGTFTSVVASAGNQSSNLQVTEFNFTLPGTSAVTGIMVGVKGYASVPGVQFFISLLGGASVVRGSGLSTVNTLFTIGGNLDTWGGSWTAGNVDATTFGVQIFVVSANPATVALDYVEITVFGSDRLTNFNGLVSVNLDQTDQTTLALDALGITWIEDVINSPQVLKTATLIPPVAVGTYLKGVDANGTAYLAFSDLTQGTSQPMQFTGQWCDRITQVGPGQAPVFSAQQSTADTYGIATITQPAQQSWNFASYIQSSGTGSAAPGTNVTIYYADAGSAAVDSVLLDAFNNGYQVIVYLTYNAGAFSYGPMTVQLTNVSSYAEMVPGSGSSHKFFFFTFTVPSSAYIFQNAAGHSAYNVTYQMSVATLTTTVPVPGLVVGNQITVSGSSPSSWNSTWGITESLNSGSVNITQTSALAGVVTYNYTLITGIAPAAGQQITVTNTLNDNGLLNGASLTIATATGGASGSFTVNNSVPDAIAVAEEAQGVTAGTIFAFDPGIADLDTSTNPIFGNGTGGSLTFSSAAETFVTPGIKQGSVFWITRNGAPTRPAPPSTFAVPNNTTGITAINIPIGPPNVVARGIIFTESGQNEVPGGNFYTYSTPVKYTVQGIVYFASALIVPDNVTTTATFSFPDSILLASDEIDVPGNNYFNLIELGNPVWMFQYATRMLYGLCQTKIQNFLNLSFDGGYLAATNPQPLGWIPTAFSVADVGTQIGLVVSPDFGNCLQVVYSGGTPIVNQPIYYQSAYQDYLLVNILQPNTAYSVRLKARALNANGAQVTISFANFASGAFAPALAQRFFTLNQGDFTILTGTILPSQAVISPTLQLVISIEVLDPGVGFQIDRLEIFPTDHPVDTTTIWTSYAGIGAPNFEAVDGVTGQLGCGDDNNQPTTGAYQILEQLYIEKTASKCVTQDSPNYEPDQWNVPLSAQGAGAIGPNAFYSEEEFSISAARPGVFLFDGGKPMPISRELQATGVNGSLWETINWAAAKTIWCRYSTLKRQLYIGVPMNVPNFWLPNTPALTPLSPNVILMCNFTGCPTAEELAESVPVHTTMFGDVKALDMRRKWSPWQIACPVAEFVTRGDLVSAPLFLCNGINSSKIYQLIDGSASGGQNNDDGAPINWLYTSYGFTGAKAGQMNPAIGALRKVWFYLAATMEGIGQVAGKLYSNSLGALIQNTFTIPLPFTLSSPQQNDQERVLEIGGQRVFIEFSSIGTGGYAEIGTIILDGEVDKNAPHRGVSS